MEVANAEIEMNETNADYVKWKKQLVSETERLLWDTFPLKIIELNKLLNSSLFSFEGLADIYTASMSAENEAASIYFNGVAVSDEEQPLPAHCAPVYKFVSGPVGINERIAKMSDIIKPLLQEAVEQFTKVKMWLVFLIPRMEGGDSFGVTIQEDVLEEVRNVETDVQGFYDTLCDYLCERGDAICLQARFPHVTDYNKAIKDIDENEFVNMRLMLTEIRDHYSTVHDIISKNIEKIRKPRPPRSEQLMY